MANRAFRLPDQLDRSAFVINGSQIGVNFPGVPWRLVRVRLGERRVEQLGSIADISVLLRREAVDGPPTVFLGLGCREVRIAHRDELKLSKCAVLVDQLFRRQADSSEEVPERRLALAPMPREELGEEPSGALVIAP